MDPIIGLVNKYRSATNEAAKMKAAEKIIFGVSDPITLFLLSRTPAGVLEDVRQTILVSIVRGLDGFRGETDVQFWAWCYQIARNTLSKSYKEEKNDPAVAMDPEELVRLVEASGKKSPISDEERVILTDALALLKKASPDCFALLWKRFMLGFGIQEIASELGLAFDAARMKINRCIEISGELLK
jgi:RNA polymerase sigma factor (sigma-70 family)